MDSLQRLETVLQLNFNDRSLFSRALTHRSYLNENNDQLLQDNERLEFLGDAVLDFVVADYLYHLFSQMDEGELTQLRAALVRRETLAGFARELSLGELLLMGHGEVENGGRDREATLCAAFEAVIGAIYLDQGVPAVASFMRQFISPALDKILAQALHKDAKSEFQIWAQAHFNVTPHYKAVGETGPDHNKQFEVQVLVGAAVWGTGIGRSKQMAAQEAARIALYRAWAGE